MLEAVKKAAGLASVDDYVALVGSRRDDVGYAAAEDRDRELHARERDLERRRGQLREGMYEAEAETARSVLDRRAQALLESGDVIESAEAHRDRLGVELQEVSDELHVLRRAIEMHKPVLERETERVSAAIRARLRPAYRRNIRRIAECLENLASALDQEAALREAMVAAGVTQGDLRPMPLEPMRTGKGHEYSTASLWLKEARRAGLLD